MPLRANLTATDDVYDTYDTLVAVSTGTMVELAIHTRNNRPSSQSSSVLQVF